MMLTDEQILEVVAFDRKYRERDRRINRLRSRNRRTIRYNYIVPCKRKEKTLAEVLGYDKPATKEVCIVNVAVRLDVNYVPIVKEVMRMYPETGWLECFDLSFYGIAGWTVRWAQSDYRRRKPRAGEKFRIGKCVDDRSYRMDYKYGQSGVNRRYDPTVNVHALAETRYKYCQYADEHECSTGLMEWLSLYRDEPKVELLAKCGLYCFICPAGLKALKDKRMFAWVKDNMKMLQRYTCPPIRYVLWAARHNTTLEEARRHYDVVHNLCYGLDSTRYHIRRGNFKLKLDYERLAGLLKKWHVDTYEYGRYLEHVFDLGYDLRNEGTLYPPTRGGRKAFMARLEELEREKAQIEAERDRIERAQRKEASKRDKKWLAEIMKPRIAELKAFQDSLKRTATLRGCGYTIVLAKTQKELLAEGRRMGNCVGNGTYGRGIVTGDKLIVMLGLGGKSYCDIEIVRSPWAATQCSLKGNKIPPDEVRELAERSAKYLKAEHARHRKLGLFKMPRKKAS